jgi:competence protein ComFB
MADKSMPKNILEDLVIHRMDELIKEADMCTCDRCRSDVLALVLNKLPSRYVVSNSGSVYAQFQTNDLQTQANITTAILKAIEVVKKTPHHERNQF